MNIFVIWALFLGLTLSAESISPITELNELTSASPNKVIEVTNSDISFIFGTKEKAVEREFWTVLALTSTHPSHGCTGCEDLQKIYGRVAKSWFADYLDLNMLYFANIDVVDPTNMQLFEDLGLTTIPHVWLIPPNKKDDSEDDDEDEEEGTKKIKGFNLLEEPRFTFQIPDVGNADQALEFARFLTKNLQKSILIRQEDPVGSFIQTFGLTLGGIILFKKRGPRIITNLGKTAVYKAIVITAILAFVCGYSFTTIQRVPFIAKNDDDEVIYISGGQSYQFGIEIVVVGANYLALGISLVSMIYFGRYKVRAGSLLENEAAKSFVVISHSVVLYLLYSCLTSIVSRKDPGYPYHFTKLF
ncbi:dolichyl-diphosphooligosaccharide--protein glycosyltransferase subunit Ost6p [[Candida] railenensis]|uniref:Dolichyl-diphosphooligosaccharide--protein glycosyltransferase subunit Ost6p n=1 Tax=[Candida] railenensis TaxID=45579 RepID=A0A9P0W071_9ASCO|nr:dolichyl-diphosphooligosaccharide--protein glycosyltransferase subunit Ost6p [[Candida] railenensis]